MEDELINIPSDVPSCSFAGLIMQAKVVTCYDGDTFLAVCRPYNDAKLCKFICRMAGYDSPEIAPNKQQHDHETIKQNALKSRQALMSHMTDSVCLTESYTKAQMDNAAQRNLKTVTLHCLGFDKYGRLLVEVFMPDGKKLNDWMVEQNYGHAYFGGTK